MADLEIREHIRRYLDGGIDAPTLEDWLENASWEAAEPVESLAENALRLLAEHANGDWTDAELRQQLGEMSRTYWFQQAPKQAFADSEARVISQESSAALGTQRVTASV